MLDGEVVASDADGRPNFARLHVRWTRPGTIHLWAFDLLAFNGRDLRPQPQAKRQAYLRALLERFGRRAIALSELFEDGLALLQSPSSGASRVSSASAATRLTGRASAGTGAR